MAIYTDTKIAQGPFLFISGQTPSQDGATPEDPQEQTAIVLKKIEEHLSANQLSWSSVVKMTVFLTDLCLLSCCPYGIHNHFGRKQTGHESRHRCRLGCP